MLLALIAVAVGLAMFIGRAIRLLFRPESSLLLLNSTPSDLDPNRFRAAVNDVMPDAKVSADPPLMSAKAGATTLRIETHKTRLPGSGAYNPADEAALAALEKHRGWTSIIVSAPAANKENAKALATKVCARLIDDNVCAVWTSDSSVVRAVDKSLVANLAAGDGK